VNVLFVIHYPVFGGPHNQALLLARSLRRRGVEMTVLLPDEPGNAADRIRAAGVDVVTMPLHRARATLHPAHQLRFVVGMRSEVGAIRRLIRDRAVDVVQIGGLLNPHAAIAARQEDTPIVWQILDTRSPMVLRRVMMPLVLRVSDMVMTTGRAVADVHPGAAGLGERLRRFYPPVEPLRSPGARGRRSRSSSPVRLTRHTANTRRVSTASRASSTSRSARTWYSPALSQTCGRCSPRPTCSSSRRFLAPRALRPRSKRR
jgi:hypothetical protein